MFLVSVREDAPNLQDLRPQGVWRSVGGEDILLEMGWEKEVWEVDQSEGRLGGDGVAITSEV